MIKSFQQIPLIQSILDELKLSNKIKAYKITKQLNQQTTIHLQCDESIDISLFQAINNHNSYPPIDIRYIKSAEYEEDKDYWDSFFYANNRFEGTTRRLENAFGKYPAQENKNLPPIVSFYSYKGGVGRSTTLAAFASYHARRTGAKILVIDCDFEAPGFSNFYGMDDQDLSAKNGVVEYLIDSSYLADKSNMELNNYIHTISASASKDPIGYAGDKGGEIHVMKAGNLSVEIIEGNEDAASGLRTHQDHYLQGLARIDFANGNYILSQFTQMLEHICSHKDFNTDVILIDSRTGFNDIFNNIALRISDTIVGFFGTSKQNIPGIYEFLDAIKTMEHSPEIILANALCTDVSDSFVDFKEIIAEYDRKTGNEMRNIPIWSIEYTSKMSKIGTPRDKGDDLLIYTDPERYRFPDYQNGSKGDVMLEYLSKQIVQKKKKLNITELISTNNTEISLEPVSKREILAPLLYFFEYENYSHAEGKELLAKDDFLNHYFYFRNYLEDLFRKDIFIIRGHKGTGKTLIYNSLQNKGFTQKLTSIYNKENNYIFLNVIIYNKYPQLDSNHFYYIRLDLPEASYWKRFWLVYVWNEIVKRTDLGFISSLETFNINNEENTRTHFENLMKDSLFPIIEKDLRAIDELLKEKVQKLVISFDYLDDIIPLETWGNANNAIATLIDTCRMFPYNHIYPKIFLRTDLYDKVHGNVNKKGLENKILSLEWNEDELFAYFFKIVYAKCKDVFFNSLFSKNDRAKWGYISNIRQIMESNNGQISIESKEILLFLVGNFFGEKIDERNANYGKSYSWFYHNLKSANDVISLRPFIALLKKALTDAQKIYGFMQDNKQPLLSGQFFASNAAREFAAQEHFEDIVGEKDKELNMFADTLRGNNPALGRYRYMSLSEADFRGLIIKIYELNGEYNVPREKWKKMVDKLTDIGVIKQNLSYQTTYSFAFLYKFYLRLSGNPARR